MRPRKFGCGYSTRMRRPPGRVECQCGLEQLGLVSSMVGQMPPAKYVLPGADTVGTYPLAGQCVRQTLGVVHDRGLHGSVRSCREVDLTPGDAGDGDDRAIAGRQQVWQCGEQTVDDGRADAGWRAGLTSKLLPCAEKPTVSVAESYS
jgi:hypothetical protein